jgi:integrase
VLGHADDPGATLDALSYSAAVQAAVSWAASQRALIGNGNAAEAIALPTLREALDRYCDARSRRSGDHGANARWRLARYVLADERLAATPLDRLTARRIQAWRDALPATWAPTTINRIMSDLRAGIAAAMPVRSLPPELRAALRVLPDVSEPRDIQLLSNVDLRRLLQAASEIDAQFGRLVLVLAATGARFSQVARLRVVDVQVQARRIMVPASRKGRTSKPRGATAVPVGDDVLMQLQPALAGRHGHEPLLLKNTGEPWRQAVNMIRPWRRALAHAGLPANIIPYALRHTSIVRHLTAGVPTRFAALLHDTGTTPIERHYAAYIPSPVEQMARAAIIPLTSATVVPLTPRETTPQTATG